MKYHNLARQIADSLPRTFAGVPFHSNRSDSCASIPGQNLIHLVFSTKDRKPLIRFEIREDLHKFAAGILRNLDSDALVMNSVSDHIHLLFNLHKAKSLSDVIMELAPREI